MNILRSTFVKTVLPQLGQLPRFSSINNYHSLVCKAFNNNNLLTFGGHNFVEKLPTFLSPFPIINVPNCGFKFKAVVKRRCKDCYIVVKDRQKIVLCRTHQRHKQKEIVPKEKDTWIITHRTSGVIRPW